MSPRNTVTFLRHLCLKIISSQLIYALSDEEGEYYEIVEKYLFGATYEVLQDLLATILGSVNLDASIRFSCLEILLRSNVKKLDTGMFPQFYHEKILHVIATRGKRLEHLNLKGVWVRDHPYLLTEVIENCRCLKTLIIPHMASDVVLYAISDLTNLLVLDICGETCFTSKSISHFTCDSLRVLDVGNFGKVNICHDENSGAELVAQILLNLPNLQYLKTYSFTGQALQVLSNNKTFKGTKLKYLHDTNTSLEIINTIIKLCPNLENLHLDTPEEGVVELLSNIPRLNTLKLSRSSIKEIMNFLRQSGCKIEVLTLTSSKNSTLDLSQLCLLVPNLLRLECYKMNLCFSNFENYFMTLQTVELLYCDMSDNVVKTILTNTPFLKRFLVGSVLNMTDGDIFRICAESELSCLEELWFSYARCLTSTSVELLMGHCPNLKVIGELDNWDVSEDNRDLLRIAVALTNTDLSLF